MPATPTPRLGLSSPAPTDPADVPLDMDTLRDELDPITVVFGQGPVGAMPPPGVPGRLYFAVDVMTLYYDDGTTWHSSLGASPGDIKPSGAGPVPPGWLLCDGGQHARSDYPILFNVLGLAFTVTDDGATFNVPDLRGRMPLGASANYSRGAAGGEERHVLSVAELASHAHGVADPGHGHGVSDPGHDHGGSTYNNTTFGGWQAPTTNGSWAQSWTGEGGGGTYHWNIYPTGGLGASDGNHPHGIPRGGTGIGIYGAATGIGIYNEGQGQGHNNMPPYVTLNWFIKT